MQGGDAEPQVVGRSERDRHLRIGPQQTVTGQRRGQGHKPSSLGGAGVDHSDWWRQHERPPHVLFSQQGRGDSLGPPLDADQRSARGVDNLTGLQVAVPVRRQRVEVQRWATFVGQCERRLCPGGHSCGGDARDRKAGGRSGLVVLTDGHQAVTIGARPAPPWRARPRYARRTGQCRTTPKQRPTAHGRLGLLSLGQIVVVGHEGPSSG